MRRSSFAHAFTFTFTFTLACLTLAACSGGKRGNGGGDGGGGGGADLTGGGGDGCSDEAKLVYVVDQQNRFASFAPNLLQFQDLGVLACPASFGATPFSMAVDRSATAWVLYSSGELFRVDAKTVTCQASSFAQSSGFANFGMGFSSDAAGSDAETLFIAGGGVGSAGVGSSKFATLDLSSMTASVRGTISLWPELTGTGAAELWGFFPSATTPKVAQLDKATGADLQTLPAGTLAGTPTAWAFAFWGGDFWIFLMRGAETSTTVYRMKSDGSVATVLPNTGRTIVGAGVSTCAPIAIM
jgi:hypothetical protein